MDVPNIINSDHDLLIRLDTKFESLIREWQSLRDSFNTRTAALEVRIAQTEKTVERLVANEDLKQVNWSRWISVATVGGVLGGTIASVVRMFIK